MLPEHPEEPTMPTQKRLRLYCASRGGQLKPLPVSLPFFDWIVVFEVLCLHKLQELLGVQMTDLLLIRRTDGCAIQEHAPLLIRTIGIIDREHDAIGPHDLQGEQKRWLSEKAASGNREVVQKVLRHGALQMLCHRREHVIDASEHKRKYLPHMPNDDLQGRPAIEHPGQPHPAVDKGPSFLSWS